VDLTIAYFKDFSMANIKGSINFNQQKERLINTGLFKKALKEGLIKVNSSLSRITYIAQNKSENFNDPEELVRAGLYIDLIYKYEYKSAEDIIEIEKFRKIGHPHKKSDLFMDAVIYDKDSNAFTLFEFKSPEEYDKYFELSIETQLFEAAANEDKGKGKLKFLIYYTRWYDEESELHERYECIDYTKFKSFNDWDEGGRLNMRYIPKSYGIKDTPPVFIRGGTGKQLRIDVDKNELDRLARELHNILWAGGKYQNELFFNLIGLFLAKIYDEKTTLKGRPYNFQIFFKGVDQEDSSVTYDRINELYRGRKDNKSGKYSDCALKRLLDYSDDDLDKVNDIIFDASKVKYVVESLQEISFVENKYDVLGDFFEKIVRQELKQTKGQYLTHHNIVDFILYGLDLDRYILQLINEENRLPYIIDPSCGSATFLVNSMKLISRVKEDAEREQEIKTDLSTRDFLEKNFPSHRKNAWAEDYIYGVEINSDLAMASKVNMVGHGDGSAHIELNDGLLDFNNYKEKLGDKSKNVVYPYPVNEQFDVVISNPPFSVTVDSDTAKNFPNLFIKGEKISKSLKGNKKEKIDTENLFIERYYQLLREGGRMGVVLPESVFDTKSNRDIRLFIYKYFWIKAIVSLPHLAFAPYTQTKTSLLFAYKKNETEVKEWEDAWVKYEEEYKDLDVRFNKLIKTRSSNEKDALVRMIKSLIGEDGFDKRDEKLSFNNLKNKYVPLIKDMDLEWWVFKKVSFENNYEIFMAHADEVGYKRSTRKEVERNNHLFKSEGDYLDREIIINTNKPITILDNLKKFLDSPMIGSEYSFKLSDFSYEKSLRLDVKFHRTFTLLVRKGNTVPLLDYFDIKEEKIDVDTHDLESIKYAEIGSCDEYGDVVPFDFSNQYLDVVEAERIEKKITDGDIQKPGLNELLIPAVRPNLNKFIYIDKNKKDIYFTTAFIRLVAKTDSFTTLFLAYLLRTVLHDTLVGLCREGKGYPSVKDSDLKFFYISKNKLKKIIAAQNKILPIIVSRIDDIKTCKEKIASSWKDIDESIKKHLS